MSGGFPPGTTQADVDRAIEQDDWETPCRDRHDQKHCVHWYDGEPCCACGDDNGPADGLGGLQGARR